MIGSWWSFLLDRQATAVIFSFLAQHEFVPLHEPSAPPTWDKEIVDIHLLCGFLACKRIRFLVTASPLFLFSSTHSMTFFSSSGHWHFLPRSAHLVFGRDFMLSIFLLQSRTNFSSMPNFRLAAELLELSDATWQLATWSSQNISFVSPSTTFFYM